MTLDDLINLDRTAMSETIAACEDVAQLSAWFTEAHTQHADIEADVHSFTFCDTADDDWLRRVGGRLSGLKKVRRRIEDRLLMLGTPPPWPPSDPRRRQMRLLEDRIRRLSYALRDAGIEVPA